MNDNLNDNFILFFILDYGGYGYGYDDYGGYGGYGYDGYGYYVDCY